MEIFTKTEIECARSIRSHIPLYSMLTASPSGRKAVPAAKKQLACIAGAEIGRGQGGREKGMGMGREAKGRLL